MGILVCVLFIGTFMYTETEMSTMVKISPSSTQLSQTSTHNNSLQTRNSSYSSIKYFLTSELTSATIQPLSLHTRSSTFNSTLWIVSTYQQNYQSSSSLSHYSIGSKASITTWKSNIMTIEYTTSELKSEKSPMIYPSVSSSISIPRTSDIKMTITSVQPQANSTLNEKIVSSHSLAHLSSTVKQNCSENCNKYDDNKKVAGQQHTSTAVIIILVCLVIILAVIGIACYKRRRKMCGSLGVKSSSASYKRFVDEDREGVNLNSML